MDAHQKTIMAAVLIIIGLTAGFLLGRGIERGELPLAGRTLLPVQGTSPQTVTLPPANGMMFVEANAIAVNDQQPGLQVMVSMVALGQGGWVVIHESEDGKPGRILGAKRFDAGSGMTGSVELLRPTEEGKVYFAMPHADDGDRQFDHMKDMPLEDPQGNIVLMRFVAASQPVQQ